MLLPIHGDCLDEMRKMDDNSIDFIVTDPPYGISFMGKGWDRGIPSIEYWKEMLRICKPGSMMACAGLPRMIHRLGCVVEDSGWIIRDMIMHLFGSGFPKSHNHFGFPGYGTSLKPAWEGWILAMKPLDGTFKQNAEKWGVAGLNIDQSRIESELPEGRLRHGGGKHSEHIRQLKPDIINSMPSGRWPANLILDEEAAEQLDQMTGNLGKSKGTQVGSKNNLYGKYGEREKKVIGHDDSGGASRFFYCAKASSSERNRGLDKPSSHPTVKPISLMKYILKLLAPPGNPICLDPFAGSGSTLLAAKELGISCIGIEKEKEYYDIMKARIG